MKNRIQGIRAMAAATVVLVVSGCANSPMLSDVVSTEHGGNVVGSFDLVKNGHLVSLDNHLLGNRAYIHVSNVSMQPVGTALVRKDGSFELELQPGSYVIDTVAFEHQGELIESQSSFRFDVEDVEKTYIGAMRLEVSLENSAFGVVGTADRMTVTNLCGEDCASHVSIMRWNRQSAQTR